MISEISGIEQSAIVEYEIEGEEQMSGDFLSSRSRRINFWHALVFKQSTKFLWNFCKSSDSGKVEEPWDGRPACECSSGLCDGEADESPAHPSLPQVPSLAYPLLEKILRESEPLVDMPQC